MDLQVNRPYFWVSSTLQVALREQRLQHVVKPSRESWESLDLKIGGYGIGHDNIW